MPSEFTVELMKGVNIKLMLLEVGFWVSDVSDIYDVASWPRDLVLIQLPFTPSRLIALVTWPNCQMTPPVMKDPPNAENKLVAIFLIQSEIVCARNYVCGLFSSTLNHIAVCISLHTRTLCAHSTLENSLSFLLFCGLSLFFFRKRVSYCLRAAMKHCGI